jgi:hypothetical protein
LTYLFLIFVQDLKDVVIWIALNKAGKLDTKFTRTIVYQPGENSTKIYDEQAIIEIPQGDHCFVVVNPTT